MPQIFGPGANSLSRFTIITLLLVAGLTLAILMAYQRSSYVTFVGVNRPQPVQFSHKHHVGDDGIDCRYCHTSVETGDNAGMPSTQTCMNCHQYIWANSPYLAPVRDSWATGKPIIWTKVHDTAQFAYFNHSVHVAKGVGCTTCHGQVNEMNGMFKTETMSMEYCITCHFNPAQFVRPKSEVFNVNYAPPANQAALGAQLVADYKIESLVSCSTCHR
ncbi:MAG: cytochrome c3 family protein [Anaerolineae bacterium]|nr:cytochrome c3 family protein [Anaerolineae bacterium]